jgi:oligoendopeptidase F
MTKYELGIWNLKGLVADPKSPAFEKQIKNVEKKSKAFAKIKSKLNNKISSKKFLGILHELEELDERLSIIGGYASLAYSSDTQSDEATSLLTRMTKLGSDISNRTLFFDLWWKKGIDEKNAKRLIKDSGELSGYLKYKRLVAKYSLSEPEERIINVLDVTGCTALVKIYDKITNAFEYVVKIEGKKKKLTREQLSTYVRSTKPKTRETAYKELLSKYENNKGVLGEIYQNIVLNWKDEGVELRGFKSHISIRDIANDLDDKTVDSLLSVCKKNAPIFHFCCFFSKNLPPSHFRDCFFLFLLFRWISKVSIQLQASA